MKFCEEVACIKSAEAQLVGILARPQQPKASGVVVLVGGPQYRVGSHRQFVLLSRALAQAGHAVLRFDVCGMGDSEGQPAGFESTGADIAAAIRCLRQNVPEVSQVALWGLCDGASAALLYWHDTQDPCVTTLCLANPWVRSDASLAQTHVQHYYRQRLMQAEFWRKLLRGSVGLKALTDLAHTLGTALQGTQQNPAARLTFQQRMAWAWARFPGHILLLLSERDFTAKEFLHHAGHDSAWKNSLCRPRLMHFDQPDADHTFSNARQRNAVAELTLRYGLGG